ncbi:MAG TPA: DUF692 family protein [Thermomicrobiales bacterium]|nr:DUF692 family protein [Thermomicrobiales bacterium]
MAPLLGVSWSPAAAALRDLSYFVDVVEAPGWALGEDGVRQQSRVLLHNLDRDMSLAAPDAIDEAWGRRANEAVKGTSTPWFSMHLGFSAERVRYNCHMKAASPALSRFETFERIVESIRRATSMLSTPLLLENLDYCPGGAYEHVCEPSFISELLSATDCGLLLDLGHLQVTASHLGVRCEDMLDRLPLKRVVELHVSSPRVNERGGLLYDAHATIVERDLDLLRLVLARCSPRMVVLEFRQDEEQLRSQLLQLGRVLKRRPRPRPC